MSIVQSIRFDETCPGWIRNRDVRRDFVNMQIKYINAVLSVKGYIYLNQLYEQFDAVWNPCYKNICYLAEFGDLTMSVREDSENENIWYIDVSQ